MTTRNVKIQAAEFAGKKSDAVRVAQVGLAGGIGFAHINEYAKNPHLQLIGGFDLYPEDAGVSQAMGRLRAAGAAIYPSFEALLADPEVEAVDICTPHHFHGPMAIAAFGAGKHVLVEKPVSPSPVEVREMMEASRAAGKVGAVQMQHLGRSSMMELRGAIQGGAIGRLKEVFLSSLWWREENYYGRIPWAGKMKVDGKWVIDGVLFNQSIHYAAQMQALCSPDPALLIAPVKDVRAALYQFHESRALEAGDTAFVTGTLDTADAPRFTMVASTCAREERHQIDLIGTQGRALWNGSGYLFIDGEPVREFHDDNKEFDGTSRVFISFAEAVRKKRTLPLTPFGEVLRTTEFLFSCYEAAGWKICKAPWAATGAELAGVIAACRRARGLPGDLPQAQRPAWV